MVGTNIPAVPVAAEPADTTCGKDAGPVGVVARLICPVKPISKTITATSVTVRITWRVLFPLSGGLADHLYWVAA